MPAEPDYRPLGRRLRRARERAGFTQDEAGAFLGVAGATISRYEKGASKIPIPDVERLASFYGVSAEGILTEPQGREWRSPYEIARELESALRDAPILVPETIGRVSAGPGSTAEAEPWPYLPQPGERHHQFRAIPVVGNCMEPEIMEGHRVIVDVTAAPDAKPGDIVVARVDGEHVVKMLEHRDGSLFLVALREQPPIEVTDRVEIVGIVRTASYRPRRKRS